MPKRRLGIVAVLVVACIAAVILSGHPRRLAEVLGAKPHQVKVTWTASKSPGVVGYNVYRAAVPGGQMVKLNRDPVPMPEFVDENVDGGHTYYYGITAVNGQHIESVRTAPIAVMVPKS